MSRTPESMISTSRKRLHDLLEGVAAVAGLVALIGFLAGGSFVLALLVCIASAFAASKVKFRLVKRAEAASYTYE